MPESKPKAKIEQLQEKLVRFAEKAVQKLFGLTQGWEKRRDIIRNNYELGQRYLKLGNNSDAVMRFKFVTWLDADYPNIWYYLGLAYLADGKPKSAADALSRALKAKPESEEAVYMLAIARGKNSTVLPSKMPLTLAREHFDALAAQFSKTQLETYQYQGHILLANAIRAAATVGRIDHVVLDLGCGTGLCGPLLRDISAQITGVDMSQPMLAEAMTLQDAQGKKIYDALIQREIGEFLAGAAENAYDIVLAAGVFSYIGDISAIFAASARTLKKGGLLAFTADRLDGKSYRFDPEAGRFRFSQTYLRGLAAANGLSEIACEEAAVYPNYPAWLCVFGK